MVSFRGMKKNRVVKILVILAFAFLLFGCPAEGNEVAVEKTCSIYGKITDENVKDMTIYKVKLTDENDWSSPFQSLTEEGKYTFNDLNAGLYRLSIYLPGKYEPVKVALLDLKPGDNKEYNYKVEKGEPIFPDFRPVEPKYREVIDKQVITNVRGIDLPVELIHDWTKILPLINANTMDDLVSVFKVDVKKDVFMKEMSKTVTDETVKDAYLGNIEYLVCLTRSLKFPNELEEFIQYLNGSLMNKINNPSEIIRNRDVLSLQLLEHLIMHLAEIGEFTDAELNFPQPEINELSDATLAELDRIACIFSNLSGISDIRMNFTTEFTPSENRIQLDTDADGFLFFADMAMSSIVDSLNVRREDERFYYDLVGVYEYCSDLFKAYCPSESNIRFHELNSNESIFRIMCLKIDYFFGHWIRDFMLDRESIALHDKFEFNFDRLRYLQPEDIVMGIVEASRGNIVDGVASMFLPTYYFREGADLAVIQQKLDDHTDPDTIKLRNILFDYGNNDIFIELLTMLSDVPIDFVDPIQRDAYIESFKNTFSQKLT